MGRFREGFKKLSSKLQESRATSPAPPTAVQTPTDDRALAPRTPQTLPKRLWNQAYEELKNSATDGTIVEAYEKVLSSQLQAATEASDNNADVTSIIEADPDKRWKQMECLVQNGLERTVQDANRKQKINQWLEMIQPLKKAIDAGIKAAPEAAVPWAGVCCALEILSSPLTEPTKNRDGMTHVLTRMDWYWELSKLLLDADRTSESSRPLQVILKTRITSLYQKLLLYEMKSVCTYHRSRFEVFMRDLPKLDNWESQLKEIKDAEAAVVGDADQYNTLEMRNALQDISTSANTQQTKLKELLFERKEQDSWQRQDRLEEKDNECLRDLRITNPQDDRETIVKAKGGLLTESYRWVIENDCYQQWLKDDSNRLLWVKGDPGKGKTMLLCGIIEELEKCAPDNVFYFFCQAAEPRLRTALAVLRGLIWFLVRKRPNLISHVRKEYDQAGRDVFNDHNAWQALSGIITAVLKDDTTEDCVFVIDALDECTEARDELISLICQLYTSCKAKWIISSRNWPEIEEQLDAMTSKVRLHLELNHAAIADAVQKFITRKVNDLAKKRRYSESIRDAVQKHLVHNANDTFLWVALVCEELAKPKVLSRHTLRVLESFPAGLNKLYERMMDGIFNSMDEEICKAILAVVAVAFEPMSLAELAASDERLMTFIDDLDTLSSIVKSCGSFLAIRDDIVYAVHQSAKDFLRTTSDVLPSGVAQQHYSIFLSSMNAMLSRLHRDLYGLRDSTVTISEISTPASHPLQILRYGCIHWIDHLHESLSSRDRDQKISCRDSVTTFLETKYLYWLEAMSLLRCVSEAIRATRKLDSDVKNMASQELRDTVQDALRFVLTHRPILDNAPLQLYDSALIFSPARSKVRQNFQHEASVDIQVIPSTFQEWDTCLQTIPGVSGEGPLCFSHDGQRLATVQLDGTTIMILDSSTGDILKTLKGPQSFIRRLVFSPDGQHLLTASHHGSVIIWNTTTWKCLQSLEGSSVWVKHVAFSQDVQLFASVETIPGPIRVWNPWNGVCVFILDFHDLHNLDIRWLGLGSSASGTPCVFIYTLPRSRRSFHIEIWDLEAKERLTGIDQDDVSFPHFASPSPDGKRLAIATSTRGIFIWDWQTSRETENVIAYNIVTDPRDITWAPDGQSLAVATVSSIILWDLETQTKLGQPLGHAGPVLKVRYGKGNQIASLGSDNSLKIWRVSSSPNQLVSIGEEGLSPILKITPGPNEQLKVGRYNGDREILSTVTGEIHFRFPCPSRSMWLRYALVFGPNHHIALQDETGSVTILDSVSGHCLHRWQLQNDGSIWGAAMAFGPSGQFASVGQAKKDIRIWDLNTGACLRTVGSVPWEDCGPFRLAFSTEGLIAAAPNYTPGTCDIQIWNSICGKKERTLTISENNIECLSFSSGGLLAALSIREESDESNLCIFNASQGTCVGRYSFGFSSFDIACAHMAFDQMSDSLVSVGFGSVDLDLEEVEDESHSHEEDKGRGNPPVWNQQYLRLSFSTTGAWLMRGPKRVLWIPRAMVVQNQFVIIPELKTGASLVAMVRGRHVFMLRYGGSSVN